MSHFHAKLFNQSLLFQIVSILVFGGFNHKKMLINFF